MKKQNAFTLVELLVVIGIMAILIGLLVVGLGKSRGRAQASLMLSNIKQHVAVFTMYTSDYSESWPQLGDPEQEYTTIRCDGMGLTEKARYFDFSVCWSFALADKYYSGSPISKSFAKRGNTVADPRWANAVYPWSFVTRPEYWDLTTRTSLSAQIGPTHVSDVQFPAYKVLLSESRNGEQMLSPGQGDPPVLGLTEGSATQPPRSKYAFAQGLSPRDYSPRYASLQPSILGAPFVYTEHGVRGRDLR